MEDFEVSKLFNGRVLNAYRILPTLKGVYINPFYGSMNKFRNAIQSEGFYCKSIPYFTKVNKGEESQDTIEVITEFLKVSPKGPDFDECSMLMNAEVLIITNIKTLREKRKLSISQIAQSLDVHESLIDWVENNKPVSKEFSFKLADFFNLKHKEV